MNEFINLVKEELEIESEINQNTKFEELEEWDSMCALILSSFIENRYGVNIKPNEFKNYKTFKDLYNRLQ